MDAESLIALAAPRGINLERAARAHRNKPRTLSYPAAGHESRFVRRPEWTVSEIGQAASGLDELRFRSALYAFAGDQSAKPYLHAALTQEADSRRWPRTCLDVVGLPIRYSGHLALLVLEVDRHQNLFGVAAPGLHAAFMHVTEKTWIGELAQRYNTLEGIWANWLTCAAAEIQARLAEEEI